MNLELNFAHRKIHYYQFILSINRQLFFRKVVGSVAKKSLYGLSFKTSNEILQSSAQYYAKTTEVDDLHRNLLPF